MDEFKNEEKDIHELKGIERRINYFTYDLNEERFKSGIDRQMKCSNLKIIDNKFNCKKILFYFILAKVCKLTDDSSYNKVTNRPYFK
jgi:hypothetical protein